MRTKSICFITGTDTGVGKTYFSFSLIKALKKLGVDAVGFKPVETGCQPSCQDAELLSKASGVYLKPVYSLKTPAAPSVAADVEGVKINVDKIKEVILKLSDRYPFLLVEGAGGLMVPINWNYLYLDLVKELSLPVLIVALNRLGVINHTLLTVKVCLDEGVRVEGVILNSCGKKDDSFRSNYESLKKLLDLPVYPFSRPEDATSIALSLLS